MVRSERPKSNLNDKISRHRGYDFVHRIPVNIMHIFVSTVRIVQENIVVSLFNIDLNGQVKLIRADETKLREHFSKPWHWNIGQN